MTIRMLTRRGVILGSANMAASFGSVRAHARTPLLASGTVFDDRRGHGLRQAGDRGIEGVLVSNGCDVARTDASGRWQLPVAPGSQVFVIKPPDWSFAGARQGAFARRIVPGLETVGAEAVLDLDFGLVRTPELAAFKAVLIADTQPATELELGYLRDSALTEIASTGAAFAINHGDVVFDNPALYGPYLQLIAATGMPWHHCCGNHDMNAIERAGDNPFETFEAVVGPETYAFQYGSAVFFVLNNVERLPPGQLTPTGYDYRGALGQRQIQFVRNVLAHIPREQLVVVSMHIPLLGFEDPNDPAGRTADAAELMGALSGRPHSVSFAGHTHTTEHHYIGEDLGFRGPGQHHHHVLTTASGSWWSGPFDHLGLPLALSRDGSPKGFHLLHVDGNRYTTELVPVGYTGHKHARMAIVDVPRRHDLALSPAPASPGLLRVAHSAAQPGRLVVNVFDGGPRTEVAATIGTSAGGGHFGPIALERTPGIDPTVVAHYAQYRTAIKPWVEPAPAAHVWTAPLPEHLSSGIHRISVTISDEYGRTSHVASLLEVSSERAI